MYDDYHGPGWDGHRPIVIDDTDSVPPSGCMLAAVMLLLYLAVVGGLAWGLYCVTFD